MLSPRDSPGTQRCARDYAASWHQLTAGVRLLRGIQAPRRTASSNGKEPTGLTVLWRSSFRSKVWNRQLNSSDLHEERSSQA